MNRHQSLLQAAAQETLDRIRKDREKAPARIKPLLAYLENHLFDPDLDFNHLKRACGIRDNTLPIQFHTALNLPPYAYIEDCRLETACRLLSDSDLRIWQISELLGYSSIQVFSRAFKRWSGLRPTAFRKKEGVQQRRRGEDEGTGAMPTGLGDSYQPIPVELLRRGVNGALEPEEAVAVITHLLNIYPSAIPEIRKKVTPLSLLSETGS